MLPQANKWKHKKPISIDGEVIGYQEDCSCSECGTVFEYANQMFYMDNGDFVCSKKCFKSYSESYLGLKKVK